MSWKKRTPSTCTPEIGMRVKCLNGDKIQENELTGATGTIFHIYDNPDRKIICIYWMDIEFYGHEGNYMELEGIAESIGIIDILPDCQYNIGSNNWKDHIMEIL